MKILTNTFSSFEEAFPIGRRIFNRNHRQEAEIVGHSPCALPPTERCETCATDGMCVDVLKKGGVPQQWCYSLYPYHDIL